MVVLSTLQNYAEYLYDQLNDPELVGHLYSHKWTILAGSAGLYALYKYLSRPRNLPPGPMGVPILGAMLSLSMNMHIDCIRWGQKYNSDIVSFYLGRQLNVILNSAESVKAAFAQTTDFAQRDPTPNKDMGLHEQMFSKPYDKEQQRLKSFLLSSVKTHGFGTAKSEEHIKIQLTRLIAHLEALPDNTTDSEGVKDLLMKAAIAVIMRIIANQNYDFDDKELEDLHARVKHFMEVLFKHAIFSMFLTNILPGFIMFFLKMTYEKEAKAALDQLRDFFRVLFEDHKQTLDLENSRDFMDDVLILNSKSEVWNDLQMIDSCMIITPDAIDTTSNQIGWALFYLSWYPEVQEKMYKEIQSLCGDDMPTLKDRNKLAYSEGVMLETLRISSIACLSGPHMNLKEVDLKGYTLPARTQIQANIYALHMDKETFPEPEQFKPERYISPDGKVINAENVVAFSTGHRKCIGEPLTKTQMFCYVSGLVQKFKMSFVEKPATPDTDNMYRAPPKHKMKFTPRY